MRGPRGSDLRNGSYARTGQSLLWLVEDFGEHLLLALTGGHKGTSEGMVEDGVARVSNGRAVTLAAIWPLFAEHSLNSRKGDSPRGGLGAVQDLGDPSVVLCQKLVAREQGASVSVRSHAEQDQVKSRVSRGVGSGKLGNNLLLVVIRDIHRLALALLLVGRLGGRVGAGRVEEELGVDRVDLFPLQRDVVEESLGARGIVGLRVVEGDDALIGEEDGPLVPLDLLDVDEGLELVGQGSAREGNGECSALVDRVGLGLEDKVGEGGLEV
jgi:hypothetical protein